MYSNMKEKVVFTLIMCSLMILCMSSYNIFLKMVLVQILY